MDKRVRAAAQAAAQRIEELDARRLRLLAGVLPTTLDVRQAQRSAARSALRAQRAHTRSGQAHDRSALAHDRAARAKESHALRVGSRDANRLRAEAQVHRLAAAEARDAAQHDRDLAAGTSTD